MKPITLGNHPDFIAVIDGRCGGLGAAMTQARNFLFDPAFQAAVIVRDGRAHDDSAARVARLISSRKIYTEMYNSLGRMSDGMYAVEGLRGGIRKKFNGAKLVTVAGHDVRDFLDAVDEAFPTSPRIELRATDGQNVNKHLDSGYEYRFSLGTLKQNFNRASKVSATPGGITVTMALRGGGTVLQETSPDLLVRTCGDFDGEIWQLKPAVRPAPISARLGWQVGVGDVSLMRACDWPETHLPSLHCSPRRRRSGDPSERVVCVGFF